MASLLMGLDIGSTYIKAAAYDKEGRLISVARNSTPAAGSGWLERLWRACAGTIKDAAERLPSGCRVGSLAVTGLGCRPVCLDEDVQPVRMESPGEAERERTAARLEETIGAERFFTITGYPLRRATAALDLGALSERPGWDRVAHVVLLQDFINLKLTGALAREYSTATSLGLWNQKENTWSEEILRTLEIPESLFGTPENGGSYLGDVTEEAAELTGLPPSTPVCLGGHDYLCAAYGCGALDRGAFFDMMGTCEIVASITEHPMNEAEFTGGPFLIDKHVYPGRYSFMFEAVCGGQVNWFTRILREARALGAGAAPADPPLEELFAAAERIPLSGMGNRPIFAPYLTGAWVPTRDATATGAFLGLRAETGLAGLTRAFLEGLCFQSLGQLEAVEKALHTACGSIKAAGGGSRYESWMRIKADVIGRPVEVCQIPEATAFGAALLSGVGTGIFRDARSASEDNPRPFKVFLPDEANHEIYHEIYDCVFIGLKERLSLVPVSSAENQMNPNF